MAVRKPPPLTKSLELPSSGRAFRICRPSGTDHRRTSPNLLVTKMSLSRPKPTETVLKAALGYSMGSHGALSTVPISKVHLPVTAYGEPLTAPAEGEALILNPGVEGLIRRPRGDRGILQYAEGEKPGFHRVENLEALRGISQSPGGIGLVLDLCECQ